MQIRPARREDLPTVAELHRASILTLCAGRYSKSELSEWAGALQADGYAQLLASREFLVAEEAGSILGFGVLDLGKSLINATYVSPAAVRRGTGRRLVEAMEQIAVANGLLVLHLSSTLNAVPFYERLGYVQKGPGHNRLPTGSELPCVMMTKKLEGARGRPTRG